jgi:hypothetical protein
LILSIGLIITPWDWNLGWDFDDEVSILVLGPFVIAVETIPDDD